ncbi:MAG TPA: hypothetical protein VHA12_03925 [Candidatus Nanoarchaeia archaeon]|nr:hypothetical protein [Candidatus Nanoarchaeia archaeon]
MIEDLFGDEFCLIMGTDFNSYIPQFNSRGRQVFPSDPLEVQREYEDYFSIADSLRK